MKSKTLLISLFFAFASSSSWSIETRGMISCGDWVKHRKNDGLQKAVSEARITSFMSGMALGSSVDILKDVSLESIYLWVDNYCQKNPFDNIYDAGTKLTLELMSRQNKP
jgi:hypothetical protein